MLFKGKKLKPMTVIIIFICLFVSIYLVGFLLGRMSIEAPTTKDVNEQSQNVVEDNRSKMKLLLSSKKIFLTYKNASNIKIEKQSMNDLKYFFNEISKIRAVENYKPTYVGYTNTGVKFSTDLVYFKLYDLQSEEFYKVPINSKKSFEKLLIKSIFTSFDFLSRYDMWNEVVLKYKDESKQIFPWSKNDLAHTLLFKREVGKVQPEKYANEKNYEMDVKGDIFSLKIETRSQDFIKVTCKGATTYYEVEPTFYNYLKEEVFSK